VSIQEWIEEKEKENVKRNVIVMVFRPFIKWLDRNLEAIVTEGLKQVCKAYYNKSIICFIFMTPFNIHSVNLSLL
jgi:hypothetical protein